jgi:hypothetical protein
MIVARLRQRKVLSKSREIDSFQPELIIVPDLETMLQIAIPGPAKVIPIVGKPRPG